MGNQTKQIPASFALGNNDEKKQRLEALDAIAAEFGINRSELIRQIADGELIVTRRVGRPRHTSVPGGALERNKGVSQV